MLIFSRFIGVVGFVLFSLSLDAQQIKTAVEKQNLVFVAETANPMTGMPRYLSPGYDLIITKEKVVASLPFYGRATSAPMDPSEAGINFESRSFDYKMSTRKKEGWDIIIKPDGVRSATDLTLTIYDNGTAILQVRSNHRDMMSFHGYVKAYKPESTK